jgi:HD-like signal output (HDOD) protein
MTKMNDGLHAAWDAALPDEHVDECDAFSKAFEFVQSLAAELSKGRVDLPAYPEVAMRVRQVLADEGVTNDRIAKIIASDAGLATRMLAMANSAALSRGGKPLLDLKLAVTRVGHDNVRSAALAYALAQLRAADSLAHIRNELAALWESSTLVAALARVLAVRAKAGNPDEAMLAGLLHNVGCVYILARAERHSVLFSNRAARDMLMTDWQAQIGKGIAQNWGLSEHVADAIGEQDNLDRQEAGRRDLVDALFVAKALANPATRTMDLDRLIEQMQPFRRLSMTGAQLRTALEEGEEEIAGLRAALGD